MLADIRRRLPFMLEALEGWHVPLLPLPTSPAINRIAWIHFPMTPVKMLITGLSSDNAMFQAQLVVALDEILQGADLTFVTLKTFFAEN